MTDDKVSLNDIVEKACLDSIEWVGGDFKYSKNFSPDCNDKIYDGKHISEDSSSLYSIIKSINNIIYFGISRRHGQHRLYKGSITISTRREGTDNYVEMLHNGWDVKGIVNNPEHENEVSIVEDIRVVRSALMKFGYCFSEDKPYVYTIKDKNGIAIKIPGSFN